MRHSIREEMIRLEKMMVGLRDVMIEKVDLEEKDLLAEMVKRVILR